MAQVNGIVGIEMNNPAVIILQITRNLSKKAKFRGEQEYITYQKGLEFAESYIALCKQELDRNINHDDPTESLSGA